MRPRYESFFLTFFLTCSGTGVSAIAQERLPGAFSTAEQAIQASIGRGEIPGAVLLVGRGDEIVHRGVYGHRTIQPEKIAMTAGTIFDLASLTKVVSTATAVMILVERGQLTLNETVSHYLPDFAENDKQDVTIEQLLLHRGGLIADNSEEDYRSGMDVALRNICNLSLTYPPGQKFVYSDVGYIVLGELVRRLSGRPLDQFARQEIFEPLGMKDTSYLPAASVRSRCAPTEQRDGKWMVGEVHDPRAFLLNGVAGHAGLFGTADDLSRFCRMILGGGIFEGKRILRESTVQEMIRSRCLSDGTNCRGYGWDIETAYSSPRGSVFEKGTTFGHTGFTGPTFWLDPKNHCYYVLLTNHVHPKNRGSKAMVALRQQVGTAVGQALLAGTSQPATATAPAVLCGIDVLPAENFKSLQGRRVALITNHTGRNAKGQRTIDLLKNARGVELVKLFSPEHGLAGTLDDKVAHSIDQPTGLKVFSLYGQTRRPNSEMLADIDTLVFDIQDIGTRFYTYIATLGYAMEAAAQHHLRMVVLDRPNPITGARVEGPLADADKLGFTAYASIPVVHGMTVGELARMFNAEKKIGCDLEVIPIRGWRRAMWWDETGLMWVNPSPNMRNLTQALLYPGIGLLEMTNVSVGRGTDQPFEYFGAPWIDGVQLAAALNDAHLPGLRFVPMEFTPASREFANTLCHGVYIIVTDRNAVQPVSNGLAMAWHLRRLYGPQFQTEKLINLLANQRVLDELLRTADPKSLPRIWNDELESFKKMRQKYLIYP
jgi:uncharacterized protein YbbC (DUF1343 family)/CubicO group peptidase (beta-lactamase class C family)